jgi:hypothetical protein
MQLYKIGDEVVFTEDVDGTGLIILGFKLNKIKDWRQKLGM